MTNNENASPDKPEEDISTGKKPVLEKKTASIKPPEKKRNAPNWSLRILLIFIVFIGGALVGIYFLPDLKERLPIVAKWTGDTQSTELMEINTKLANQQIEIDALSNASAVLETRLGNVAGGADEDAIRELEAKLVALEGILTSTSDDTVNAVIPPVDNSQSTRIDMLLSRMSQLEASFVPLSKGMIDAGRAEKERQALIAENTSLSTKMSNLESRLLSVEKVAAKDNSGILLNYKVAELKRKLVGGLPYSTELDAIKKLVVDKSSCFNSALNYLSENAPTGVPTPDQLKKKFNDMIPNILNVEGLSEDASWWQMTLNKLKNMITIRKTVESSGGTNGLDSLITEIEGQIETSNLGPALDLANQMPGAIQNLLEEWKVEAEIWIESETAINTLENLAAESLLTPVESENTL